MIRFRCPALLTTLAPFACAATVCAQGGLVWPVPSSAPEAIVIRIDEKHYDVLFPGFATYPSSLLDGNDDTAVGVGIEPGSVRTVDETEVVDETTGGTAEAAPLFDFKYDLGVTGEFDAMVQKGALQWNAFVAKPTSPIPSFRGSALRFRFSSPTPINPSLFVKQIRKSVVGIGQVDGSGKLRKNARLFTLSTAQILPAAPLYYKFERKLGDIALNYVNRYAGAPPFGELSSSTKKPITTGWKGSGLLGGNATTHHSCDTGFEGGIDRSFTIAWYAKQRNAPGTAISRFFEISGGIRCETGGAVGKGLRITGWGVNAPALDFSTDVQTPAATNWVHLALVFDGVGKRVRLYVDGVAKASKTITKSPRLRRTSRTLVIGGAKGSPNFYDIDEFRLGAFAALATRVNMWKSRPSASSASYGSPSGCLMQVKNGPPGVGNAKLEIWVTGTPNANVAMVFGTPTQPFPFSNGLWNIAFPALIVQGKTSASGSLRLPISIPKNPALRGKLVDGQAYMVTPKNNGMVSNAVSMSIE